MPVQYILVFLCKFYVIFLLVFHPSYLFAGCKVDICICLTILLCIRYFFFGNVFWSYKNVRVWLSVRFFLLPAFLGSLVKYYLLQIFSFCLNCLLWLYYSRQNILVTACFAYEAIIVEWNFKKGHKYSTGYYNLLELWKCRYSP